MKLYPSEWSTVDNEKGYKKYYFGDLDGGVWLKEYITFSIRKDVDNSWNFPITCSINFCWKKIYCQGLRKMRNILFSLIKNVWVFPWVYTEWQIEFKSKFIQKHVNLSLIE